MFYGSGIAPSYFPALMKMVTLGHFYKTEPRDKKGYNPAFFECFMIYHQSDVKKWLLKPLLSIKLYIIKYCSKNSLRNSNHFQGFRQSCYRPSPSEAILSICFRGPCTISLSKVHIMMFSRIIGYIIVALILKHDSSCL